MEGVVVKLKDGRYHAEKRTVDFIKIINYTYVDVQIAGYRKGDLDFVYMQPKIKARVKMRN
ncbi:hypothetical protein [Brevibacillus brevis]|uniref:hypothetical protein n=1 Tax=Brevibacillus brevis TaxID=1393 RepID=UPI0016438908|nr:hypothetical protein [Brevibacillus brevis]